MLAVDFRATNAVEKSCHFPGDVLELLVSGARKPLLCAPSRVGQLTIPIDTAVQTVTGTPLPISLPVIFFFYIYISSGGWGKNKALAHHTSTYFHTRRVLI